MTSENISAPVLQLRVAVTAAEYDRIVEFYCEALGIPPVQRWENDGGHALMLEMGTASLEIFDEAQAQAIDKIEVGRRVSGAVRFALQVPDVQAAVERAVAHRAVLVHEPVATPWGDRNARLQAPDGMQVTLFQVSAGAEED